MTTDAVLARLPYVTLNCACKAIPRISQQLYGRLQQILPFPRSYEYRLLVSPAPPHALPAACL